MKVRPGRQWDKTMHDLESAIADRAIKAGRRFEINSGLNIFCQNVTINNRL